MKTVIVGGVAGGATAAARLRRLDEHMDIVLIERGAYISFANCGLPYYVGGDIYERDDLTLQTPEDFSRFASTCAYWRRSRTSTPGENRPRPPVKDGSEYTEPTISSSPGARPFVPPIRARMLKRLPARFRTPCHPRLRRKQQLQNGRRHRRGFIGLEMAETSPARGSKCPSSKPRRRLRLSWTRT